MTTKLPRLSADPADRELRGLCVLVAVSFVAWTMAAPLVPLLLIQLKASPSTLGAVIGLSTIGSLLVAVPGGRLVGVWGSERLMFWSSALCAASAVLLAFFPSILGLCVGLFFLEIGKLLFILGAQAHIGALGEGRDLNLDYGWYSSAAAFGQLFGPLAAGILIDIAGHRITWAVIAGLGAVVVAGLPRLVSNRTAPLPPDGAPRKGGLLRFLNGYTLMAIIASFAVLFADGARGTFFPVLMDGMGYSATTIGFFMSLRALVSMSVRLFMGRFVDLAGGRFPALVGSILVMSVGIALTPFFTGWLGLTLNTVLIGIGLGLAIPLSMATVSGGAAPEDRGVVMGIRLTGNRLAQFINPVFFGLIAQHFGIALSFVAGGVVLLVCALPIALWWRGQRRRAADL